MAPNMSETQPEVSLNKGDDMGAVQGSSAPVSAIQPKDVSARSGSSGNGRKDGGGAVEYVGGDGTAQEIGNEVSEEEEGNGGVRKKSWFAYVKTKQFWVVLLLGQVLAICITSTNTFSTLLSQHHTSIPAFQSLFTYVLLNLIYTTYTIYIYGFRRWLSLIYKDGWRFFLLAFCDVEGNYFVVLAYRYTTILSAQLINFWAIVVVVLISLLFLRVRYHWTQIAGILLCIGGMGILFGSDHLTGNNAFPAQDQLKGDLFALLGATFYGLANTCEEWMVSKRPVYEVLGQLSFWALLIIGVQAAIFDRASFRTAEWSSAVGGYLTGFTLIMTLFYSLAPLVFRLSSAAFFNISLLTGSFWGVAIGVEVFGYEIHWMYPIAFVCILGGQVVYFLRQDVLAESMKPWLGEGQVDGVAGLGTAKRRVERPGVVV